MPIYTFSTPTKNTKDTELIQRTKQRCEKERRSFSGLILELLAKYEKERDNERSTKV